MVSPKASLIISFVVVFSFVSLASCVTCPAGGVVCYPAECGTQFQQCSGTTFYAPQACPAGTVCKGGNIVYPSDCPSSSAAAATVATSTTTAKAATTAAAAVSTSAKAATTTTTAKAGSSTSGAASNTGSSAGSCSLSSIFTQADFNALFPYASGAANRGQAGQYPIFSYSNLINAAAYYPDFACTGDLTTRKRELAAFLGQTSQESSGWWSGQPYNWGYFYSTELCAPSSCSTYCSTGACGSLSYYGRGPLQLSWNYNYAQVSAAVLGDSTILLNNPDKILTDGVLAFRTSLWFWMTAQAPKPSSHSVMTGGWIAAAADVSAGRLAGYGMVTNIVNGGIECQTPTPQAVTNRVAYFQVYCSYFGITPGSNLYCDKMQHY